MQAYQMVVFDMAGTTISEDNIVYKTLAASLTRNGYETELETVLLYGAGKEKLQAIKDILQLTTNDMSKAEGIYEDFKASLENAYHTEEVAGFEAALPTFKKLRENNIYAVLNTGYDRHTAELLLKRVGWKVPEHFDLLVTASEVEKSRPYGDMILLAMEKLGIHDSSAVIKVGDSAIDIEEGKNANCGLTFGITTGAQTVAQLQTASPDHIIESLLEIPEILKL